MQNIMQYDIIFLSQIFGEKDEKRMWYGKESVYQGKFEDPLGIFFTEEEFPQLAKAGDDVSDVLQAAIDRLIKEQCYGILYIPEGEYRMKKTVKIPPSVRLIGYGKKRPVFVLPAHTKGYELNTENLPQGMEALFVEGYPGANYMFWFIGERDTQKADPKDANAGTFYSALSNIDFKVEEGNPGAVCIRAHFAQHGFISHCHFDLGDGLAAMFDVGNEMEDLTIEGGTYGMICRMTSPSWPFALFDTVFDGQKETAILTTTTGFTGFRLHIKNTPKAFDLYHANTWEKLYLEDCIFENISCAAINSHMTGNMVQQTNLKNIACKNVTAFICKADIEEMYVPEGECYLVEDYGCGYMQTQGEYASYDEVKKVSPLAELPVLKSDIPALPPMEKWVSVAKYGAKGDGETDDTKALQEAFDKEKIVYLPQGIYKISDTLYLRKDTYVYGMSPVTTQIVIADDEPAFAGFGTPKPLLETAEGGFLYFNGIGIDTAGKNPRAAGFKWMADETSYMNDVKFMGGHGLMFRDGRNPFACLYNATRTADYDPDRLWDFQYSSLWITNGGGGVFKDVWSASPYAEAGIAITNTETPGKMYAISLEHHVRCEMKLNKVKNWTFYAMQTEEEKAEGMECQPLELVSCENVKFANLFMFRVVAVDRPAPAAIRTWDCKDILFMNLHNKAQMQYIFTLSLQDETSGFYGKSPEYARLLVSGERKADAVSLRKAKTDGDYKVITDGCIFAQGAVFDKEGNLFWCDKTQRKIYRYDAKREVVTLFYDIHFIPSALAMDNAGNLLVAVDYSELKKTVPGQSFQSHDTSNYHPFFSWFYKRSERVYAVSLEDPYNTMTELTKVPAGTVQPKAVWRPAHLSYYGLLKEIVEKPIESYYMAPDGETALEGTIDLARSLALGKMVPGETAIVMDDSSRKAFAFEVTAGGNFKDGESVSNKGQYSGALEEDGTVLVVDDMLYGFKDGEITEAKEVPWDAYAILKKDGEIYLMGRGSVYRMM